jgi:hypothetical protein
MVKKINFDELNADKNHQVLKKMAKGSAKEKERKPEDEKLTAQVKVNLKPREKKQLEKIAGRNLSAFVREVLLKEGSIY